MRAIAAARRLCTIAGARCTLVWDWGCFADFFEPMSNVDVVKASPFGADATVVHASYLDEINPSRTVDLSIRTLELHSGYPFRAAGEPAVGRGFRPYFPQINASLCEKVASLVQTLPAGTVGMHVRRTDNAMAIACSPDSLFLRTAQRLISRGRKILLMTDNLTTREKFQRILGSHLITFPKRQNLSERWPRCFDQIAAEDDLVDLFSLAQAEWILGSYGSSFSQLAIHLNGSEQSGLLFSNWRTAFYHSRIYSRIQSRKLWARLSLSCGTRLTTT